MRISGEHKFLFVVREVVEKRGNRKCTSKIIVIIIINRK